MNCWKLPALFSIWTFLIIWSMIPQHKPLRNSLSLRLILLCKNSISLIINFHVKSLGDCMLVTSETSRVIPICDLYSTPFLLRDKFSDSSKLIFLVTILRSTSICTQHSSNSFNNKACWNIPLSTCLQQLKKQWLLAFIESLPATLSCLWIGNNSTELYKSHIKSKTSFMLCNLLKRSTIWRWNSKTFPLKYLQSVDPTSFGIFMKSLIRLCSFEIIILWNTCSRLSMN